MNHRTVRFYRKLFHNFIVNSTLYLLCIHIYVATFVDKSSIYIY